MLEKRTFAWIGTNKQICVLAFNHEQMAKPQNSQIFKCVSVCTYVGMYVCMYEFVLSQMQCIYLINALQLQQSQRIGHFEINYS